MTLLIVGWSLTSIWCSTASTRKARSWRSTVCCEVHGTCRSIWNKFRFECCGQCSTKTRASDLGQGLFCCVIHQPTSEQDGTGREQQRSRPPPAAETGRRGWGRVLIFQGPAKGLRKNQQTQLVKAAHLSYSFRRNVYQESSACRSTVCRTSVYAVPDRNNVSQSHS